MAKPRLIALCAWPQSGKTTVAEFLVRRFGARLVDDGAVLREAAMALYGLSWDDVYTQEGKLKAIEVCGRTFTHRQLCGHLGNLLEGFYGEQYVPEQTLRRLAREADDAPFYVFPSVRKTQGETYLRHGGVVIEVVRAGIPEPENDFDRYDRSLVTYQVANYEFSEDNRLVDRPLDDFLASVEHLFTHRIGYRPL